MGFGAVNVDLGGIVAGIGKIGVLFKDIRAAITGKAILDPGKEAEVQAKILEIESLLTTSQTEINKMEAQHPSVFVSGWRPYIGWICGTGITIEFILNPIVQWILLISGSSIQLPHINIGVISSLITGMLGLGALRTYEGVKRVKRIN